MLRPIEVMALDENFNRASGGIAYRSLIWRRRYYEYGTFELYVPKNIYKPSWKYIYTADRPETGIIETVCATDDVHAWGGIDTVKVSGRFAESLLSRKVLIPSRVTGYGSTGDNVAVSMQWAQEIFGDRFTYLAPDFEGVERPMAPKPSPYGLILYDELKMAEASYRVLYDFTGNTWTVQPWRGLDRTQSQLPIAPDPDEPDVPDEPTIDELYEPLDYIVATGEQWIDTGVYPNGNTRVVTNARWTAIPASNTALFGARNANTLQFWFFYYASQSSLCFRYGDGSDSVNVAGKPTDWNLIDMNANTASVGGNSASVDKQTFTASHPLFLFGVNNAGSVQFPCSAMMKDCQIYQDGTTLTQDLVPKRRIADGAVGMLDLVNEVFYPSASGVAFLAPGELPAGYTRLEYIESTGSQYIDTGFNPKFDTRVVFDISDLSSDAGQILLGSRSAVGPNAKEQFLIYRNTTTTIRTDYFNGSNKTLNISDTSGKTTIDKNANVTSMFGVTVTDTAATSGEVPYPLYLFALNESGTPLNLMAKMKGRSCQIYDGATLVRDYIPAKNGGGEAGLFDMVSMTFYADAAGVGFVAGPEVTAVSEVSTFALTRTVAASEETTEISAVNAFALFSDQMGTIRDYVAVKDSSGYKNTCVIDYEYEEPASWNDDGTPYATPIYEWIPESAGTARELVGYQIHYNIKRGTLIARIADDLPDDEAYLDLTGTKPPYDGEWSRSQYKPDALPDFPTDMRASYAAFPAALEAEGFKHLQANYPYVEEIDTGELSTGGYLKRWDLGDKVDALLLDIGIDMEARITGVDEVYEGATRSVTPIIGEKKHRRL